MFVATAYLGRKPSLTWAMSESADVRSMANGRLTFIAAHYTKSPRPRRSLQSKQIPPQQDLVRTIISFSRCRALSGHIRVLNVFLGGQPDTSACASVSWYAESKITCGPNPFFPAAGSRWIQATLDNGDRRLRRLSPPGEGGRQIKGGRRPTSRHSTCRASPCSCAANFPGNGRR